MTATTLHLAPLAPTPPTTPTTPRAEPIRPALLAGAPAQPGRQEARRAPAPRHGWIADAACTSEDPGLFDPVNRHVASRATAVCDTCPVRRSCLLDALVEEQDTAYGPWLVRGGMTPKERRDLTRSDRATLVDDLRGSPALDR